MDINQLLTPWNIFAFISSLAFSFTICFILIMKRESVFQGLSFMTFEIFKGLETIVKLFWQFFMAPFRFILAVLKGVKASVSFTVKRAGTKAGFFYLVIIAFMCVSVVECGGYFNIIDGHILWDVPGYAAGVVIDLVALLAMQARLDAVRKRESSWLYIVGVFTCAGLSAFANVAMSLHVYSLQATQVGNQTLSPLSGTPDWMQGAAPWTGMAFPLLIVLVSIIADRVVDTHASDDVDLVTFKNQQMRRVDRLKVRHDAEALALEIEEERHQLLEARKANQRRRRGKLTAEEKRQQALEKAALRAQRGPWLAFVLHGPAAPAVNVEELVAQSVQGTMKALEPHLKQVGAIVQQGQAEQAATSQHLRQMAQMVDTLNNRLQEIEAANRTQTQQLSRVSVSLDDLKRETPREIPALKRNMKLLETMNETPREMKQGVSNETESVKSDSSEMKQKALNFISRHWRETGKEPSIDEIMADCGCSTGSAFNYRSVYRKQPQAV